MQHLNLRKNMNLKCLNPKLWLVCSLGIYSITILNILLNLSETAMFFPISNLCYDKKHFFDKIPIFFLSEGLLALCPLENQDTAFFGYMTISLIVACY